MRNATVGMEGIGFGINKMEGVEGPFGCGVENFGRFGSGMNMGIIKVEGGGRVPGIKWMGPSIGDDCMEHMGAGLAMAWVVWAQIERMRLVID